MGDVKISALELENVKRVRALRMEPTTDGLTVIGGRNAQGKTSVLDAIAWALGGDKMRPAAPNRDGAANPAHLHVELSNGIVVERRGKNGALHVTDARGMRGGQQLLNEFVSQLALDLPRFLSCSDKERADYMLTALGVTEELARLDRELRSAMEERRDVGREADARAKAVAAMPDHAGVPDDEVSVAGLSEQLQAALRANADNQATRDELRRAEYRAEAAQSRVRDAEARLRRASEELDAAKADADVAATEAARLTEAVSRLADTDVAGIERAIRDAEATNQMVRQHKARVAAAHEADRLAGEYEALTQRVEGVRAERVALLDGAGMPLPGLSVEDGVLTYNGHVWSDMSGAEQLRVATAIVRSTKPGCGFVLVDKLEQLDPVELAEFARWCEGEGLQVIGTRVATDDSCTVVIEDGRIVGQEMEEAPAPDPRGKAIEWGDEF